MSRTRSVSICVAVAGALALAPSRARADDLPNGAVLTFGRFFIYEGDEKKEPSTPDVRRQYLNLAHCECSRLAKSGTVNTKETSVFYEMTLSPTTNESRAAELWVGSDCGTDTGRVNNCRRLEKDIPDLSRLAISPEQVEFGLYDVINAKATTERCISREGNGLAWVLYDNGADGTLDYSLSQSIGASMEVSGVDTTPPPLPTDFAGESAESAIRLSWTVPTVRATDIKYYQAFCIGPDDAPVTSDPIAPRYQTATTLCDAAAADANTVEITATEISGGDGTDVTTPVEFTTLDPNFLCGESTESTATGMFIRDLQNDVPYRVMLVAIDYAGNATGAFFTTTITPQPATDFWEDLHDRGSDVEGGFCLLAETYGDGGPITQALRAFRDGTLGGSGFGRALTRAYYASMGKLGGLVHGSLVLRAIAAVMLFPLVVIALAWHVLTLPGLLALVALFVLWRRKRISLPRLAPAAALGCILLGPTAARAQGPSPYWDGASDDATADSDTDVKWQAGIRVGPYVPDIDKQFGQSPGPYEDMFGGYQVLPMLDVDRMLWTGFGQLGIGGSIGYMQKTARAWVDGSVPGPDRMRSAGDKNTFRLIPLALSVTYRFTYLDDEYGIPLVPYVRGGLAYYIWSVRTNGETAKACWDGTHNASCDADKGYGASLGFVGSIGLAIRAERIDANAASSMRQSGIMHAGFYGELSLAKVDGFGSATKLSVGDRTWFAGVNFEF